MGSIETQLNLLENLKATWRLGGDISNENGETWHEYIRPEGNNRLAAVFDPGSKGRSYGHSQQLNSDLIITWSKSINKLQFDVLAGQSLNERRISGFSRITISCGRTGRILVDIIPK